MKEPKRRRSLSGAVLVMILTIMFVLIILLTATLTTVTTANQRIYTKFEENQAYYTARSALDVFTQNMLADKGYYAYKDAGTAKSYIHGDNVTSDKMKQGLGLQLDLYSITSKNGMNITQADLYSYANGITLPADKKDEYKNYFGTKPNATSPAATGADINDIWYEVELPQTGNGANKYGKMSDYKSSTTTSVAKIKVEVENRSYDMGAHNFTSSHGNIDVKTYLDTLSDDDLKDYFDNLTPLTTEAQDVAKAIAMGNRKKDTMRIKITATTEFDGVEGTAILVLDSNQPPVNNSSRAITAFGSALGTNHAYIVGGMSMVGVTGTDIPWSNAGGVYGTVHNEAGINFNVATPIYLTESEYLFIAGDLNGNNGVAVQADVTDTDKNKRPFIYVGGSVKSSNFSSVGGSTATEKVDMIVHGISWTGNNFYVNGDIYSDGNCTFDSTAATPSISGDLYIKGNLNVGGNVATVDGDGNLTSVNLGACNIYLSGNIIYNSNPYSPTSITNSGGIISSYTFGSSNWNVPTITDVTDVTSGDLNVEVQLPNSIKKQIDTHKTNYDDYYVLDSDGNYVDANGDGFTPDRQTAIDMAGVDFTQSSFLPTDTINAQNGVTVSIDTNTDPTKYILYGGQNFNGSKILISGGGTVEIILKPSWGADYSSGNGHLDIIVDDDTTLKVYGGDAGVEYTFNTVAVWTQTTYDAYVNGTTLNVGNQTGHNIKVPKIYYYFSGGKVNLSNGRCFLTGYFFGPTTALNATAGSNITFSDLKYNGASVSSGWKYTVLGSVLCDDFNLQNDHGIIYINPDLDNDTAGEPIHNWQSYQYVRN